MESPTLLIAAVAAAISAWFIPRAVRSAWSHRGEFPQAHWQWPDIVFAFLLAAFFLAMGIASYFSPVSRIPASALISSLQLYGALIIFVTGFLMVRNLPVAAMFGLRWPQWRSQWWMVPWTLFLVLPWIAISQWAVYSFLTPEANYQPVVLFLIENTDLTSRLLVALVAVVAAPITEELVFRGVLYGALRQMGGAWAAALGTSLLFALIHGHVASLPGLFLLAVGLALLVERTGSLWLPILLHALFNATTIVSAILWPNASP